MLNGFDRNRQEVFDQADFFLQERLAVGHSPKHTVEASHGVHAGTDLLMGREEILACFLIAELRFVGKDGGKLFFELIADIDDECRPNVVIKGGVDNLERSMRGECRNVMAARTGSWFLTIGP
jgi:hypothetical protein